jgi:hypothetical protein
MKASMRCLVWIVCLVTTALMAQEVRLGTSRVGAQLRLDFPTEIGKLYEIEMSQNLQDWGPPTWSGAGDGQGAAYEVSMEAAPLGFFRLVVRESSSGFAPEGSVMSEALVGVTWQGYEFQSPTRFDWMGEGGNWSYQKTGPDEGLLIFTYDEDGNNPGVYREEVVLVFETASSGTYRYSEYVGGIEDPGSVAGGSMDFTFLLDLSPTAEAMAVRLVGRTWEGYVFTTETRFDWESPGHTGDWHYQKTGKQTGLLVFTYDEDGNDPQVYREQITLTFNREDRGTALYSEYANGVKRSGRDRFFAFTLPPPPEP